MRPLTPTWLLSLAALPFLNAYVIERSDNSSIYDEYQSGLSPPVYPSPNATGAGGWDEAFAKAAAFVANLTLEEKADMVSGKAGPCTGNIKAVKRVGFGGLCLQDGPLAIRLADFVSVFPAGLTTAATWDRDLMYERGYAMGSEFKAKGSQILLGPVAGPIGRSALAGRNWEGFSPDPYLTGVAMEKTITGIQDSGTQACGKHFIGNEQETLRNPPGFLSSYDGPLQLSVSSDIDDRTMHELYLWPFANSVKAGVSSLMCSYNRVNGSYACQNSKVLNGLLKEELGFQGYVMSDWGATHTGVAGILAGQDMDMPGYIDFYGKDSASYFGGNVTTSVQNGTVEEERLDDMIRRIMTPYFLLGQDQDFPTIDPSSVPLIYFSPDNYSVSDYTISEPSHRNVMGDHDKVIREIGGAASVLLKNTNGALPLKNLKYVGLFGNGMGDLTNGLYYNEFEQEYGALAVGGGSGSARFTYIVSPLEALKAKAREDGFHLQYIQNNTLASTDLSSFMPTVEELDVCIVFIKTFAKESVDRSSLEFDYGGDDMVYNVANNCSNTVVVTYAAGINLMPWATHPNVTAILAAHLPGQEMGLSLVDVLFGDVNPSGKLPYTVALQQSDYDFAPVLNVTAGDGNLNPHVNFTEGLNIDYRHFDAQNKSVLYEFGYGLSYTTFELSGFKTLNSSAGLTAYPPAQQTVPGGNPALWETVISLTATVTNTGNVTGATVPQLYVSFPDSAPSGTPVKQLRGFEKVSLDAASSKTVTFELMRRDVSYWDIVAQDWKIPSGTFTFSLGLSSRDIKATVEAAFVN